MMNARRRPAQLPALVTLLLVSATIPVGAADLSTPALPSEIAPLADARSGMLELDLEQAYGLALGRNLDLVIGRYDLAVADANVEASTGLFDPYLSAGVNGDFTRTPAATALEGADIGESRNTRFNLGISSLLPTGTEVAVTARTTRSETNSQFALINPSWSTSVSADLTQPLLDGFGTFVNRSGLVLARNSRAQTAVGFELTVVSILQAVEDAYWNLAAARAAISVRQRSLELAQRLLDETQERVKVGTSAPIDLVQSEAGVASRSQDLIVARNSAGNAEDVLKSVLGFDDPAEWLIELEITEEYETDRIQPDLADSIETALAERPELASEDLVLDALQVNERLARNAVLPTLDLSARYGFSGIGGSVNDTNPIPGMKSGFSDSISQVTDFDFPNWSLGLQLTMPIGNTQARADLARQRWQIQQQEARTRALEQQIIREVRTAVRALEDGAASLDAAQASLDLAERNLEAEQTKFNNGLSTNFQVLQIQDDLAVAQLTLIQSYLSYRRSIVAYRVATGTLLDDYGIEIMDPGAPEVRHDYWGDVEWLQFDDLSRSRGAAAGPEPTASTEPAS